MMPLRVWQIASESFCGDQSTLCSTETISSLTLWNRRVGGGRFSKLGSWRKQLGGRRLISSNLVDLWVPHKNPLGPERWRRCENENLIAIQLLANCLLKIRLQMNELVLINSDHSFLGGKHEILVNPVIYSDRSRKIILRQNNRPIR